MKKMTETQQRVAAAALKGASKGAGIGAAATIVGGAALVYTPVLFFWTAVTISAPVVIAGAAIGAAAVGAAAGYKQFKKDQAIRERTKQALERAEQTTRS
jgi:hypothetical protein